MKRNLQRFLAATAGVAMLSGAGGVVFAHSRPASTALFTDLGSVRWAQADVTLLGRQRVLLGLGGGRFHPSGATTRDQMAVVLGRLLGWHGGGSAGLTRFTDVGSISPWARSAVAQAVHLGFLKGEGSLFAPHQAVTWSQTLVILARALKLPAVPASEMPAVLASLPRQQNIPAWAREGVARSAQAGLLKGVLGRLFAPNASVTRAELAVLLARGERLFRQSGGVLATPQTSVTGTVAAVSGNAVTLSLPGGASRTLTLAANATVYLSGQTVSLSTLSAGDTATAVLSGSGQALTVVAVNGPVAASGNPVIGTLTGTDGTSVTVQVQGGGTATYPVAPGAQVTLNGSPDALLALADGTAVTLTVNGSGQVTAVAATSATQNGSTISGTYTSSTYDSLTLLLPDGSPATFPVASAAPVTLNGAGTNIQDLATGDSVTLTVVNGTATVVTATSLSAAGSVSGTLVAAASSSLTVNLTSGGQTTYDLASGASVTWNGTPSSLTSIPVGADLTVSLQNGQATTVTATSAPVANTSGLLLSQNGTTLTIANGGTVNTVPLAGSVTVTLNGFSSSLGTLVPGDSVVLTESAAQVDQIDATAPTSILTGTLLAQSGGTLTVAEGSTSVAVTSGISPVYLNDLLSSAASLTPGTVVSAVYSGSTVTAVIATS